MAQYFTSDHERFSFKSHFKIQKLEQQVQSKIKITLYGHFLSTSKFNDIHLLPCTSAERLIQEMPVTFRYILIKVLLYML